jgi:hypothetical protein
MRRGAIAATARQDPRTPRQYATQIRNTEDNPGRKGRLDRGDSIQLTVRRQRWPPRALRGGRDGGLSAWARASPCRDPPRVINRWTTPSPSREKGSNRPREGCWWKSGRRYGGAGGIWGGMGSRLRAEAEEGTKTKKDETSRGSARRRRVGWAGWLYTRVLYPPFGVRQRRGTGWVLARWIACRASRRGARATLLPPAGGRTWQAELRCAAERAPLARCRWWIGAGAHRAAIALRHVATGGIHLTGYMFFFSYMLFRSWFSFLSYSIMR